MHRINLDQRFEILKTYFECDCDRRDGKKIAFGRNEAPSNQSITNLIKKLRRNGMLVDIKHVSHARPRRTPEAIAAVAENVRMNASTSTRRRCQQLGLSRTTLRMILHKDLGMFAYKVQLVQELKQVDHPQRFRFAEWALNQLNDDPNFARKIIFSDKAHFYLGGYVNKQNCRIWATENPHVAVTKPIHHLKQNIQAQIA